MYLDLNAFVNPLKKINPNKIILFGSYAYGTPNKDSDVDLLVVLKTDRSFHQRIRQIRSLLPKDTAIDLIVLTPKEYQQAKTTNSLVAGIDSKGKVIYG